MGPRCFTAAENMVRIALLAALMITTAKAQAPAQDQAGRKDVAEVTVQGCLQGGAERTTLTDQTGTTYLLDKASISPKPSVFVEVRGEQLSPAGQQGEAALPEIRVDSVRRLSDICPQRIMKPPSSAKPPLPSAQSPSTGPYQSPIAPQAQDAAPVLNTQGAGGAPSPGTGNSQDQPPGKSK